MSPISTGLPPSTAVFSGSCESTRITGCEPMTWVANEAGQTLKAETKKANRAA